MIQRFVSFLMGKALFIAWVLVHFLYQLQSEIRERVWWDLRLLTQTLVQCLPSHSVHGEIARLAKVAAALPRTPHHIAISVIDKEPPGAISTLLRNLNLVKEQKADVHGQFGSGGVSNDGIDLQALAKVISWAWVANIPIVSLYDHRGIISYKAITEKFSIKLRFNLDLFCRDAKMSVSGAKPACPRRIMSECMGCQTR